MTKPKRLTFPMSSLEPVQSGIKTCTIRLSKRAAAIQSGDALALCFGNRMQPVVLHATAARVEHLDVTDDLKALYLADAELDALSAEGGGGTRPRRG